MNSHYNWIRGRFGRGRAFKKDGVDDASRFGASFRMRRKQLDLTREDRPRAYSLPRFGLVTCWSSLALAEFGRENICPCDYNSFRDIDRVSLIWAKPR